jgi:OmpA-OmpF porin, OOP family
VVLTLTPVKDVLGKKTDINADILFDVAKSELKPEAAAQIRFLAEFVKREKLSLELGGYTDPSGSEEDNLKLSQARAEAVRTALVNAGVKADNITATGYGESDQVCTESTPECMRKNRRVVIKWK